MRKGILLKTLLKESQKQSPWQFLWKHVTFRATASDSHYIDGVSISNSIIYISFFSILTGSHHPCSPYIFTNEDIKQDSYFSTSCTFRILFHQIITLVSRTLRIFFHLIVTLISRALRILLHSKVTSVSRAFQHWLTFDFDVSILRSFRIIFHWIVASVSRSQLGFSFILSSLEYLAHF